MTDDTTIQASAAAVPAAQVNPGTFQERSSPAVPDASTSNPMWTAPRILLLSLCLVLAAGALYQVVLDLLGGYGGYDFSFYYVAALAIRENAHANIYDPHMLRAVADAHHVFLGEGVYQYPPLLPILVIPLTFLSFVTATRVWLGFDALLWAASTLLLADLLHTISRGRGLSWSSLAPPRLRRLRRHADRSPADGPVSIPPRLADSELVALAVAAFISLTFAPLAEALWLGQASMLVLTLILAVPLLERKGYAQAAGVVLALATMVKILPVVLLGYYLLRGRWRVMLGAAVALAGLLAGIAAIIGVQGVMAMTQILPNGVGDSARFQNQALARVPMWIALEFGGQPSALVMLVGYALAGLVAVAFAAGVILANSGAARTGDRIVDREDLLGYGWALCTMFLVSPIAWEHHAAWLLPAMSICLGWLLLRWSAGAGRRTDQAAPLGPSRGEVWVLAAVLLCFLLNTFNLPFSWDSVSAPDLGYTLLGYPMRPPFMVLRSVGAFALWLACGAVFVGQRRATGRAMGERWKAQSDLASEPQ